MRRSVRDYLYIYIYMCVVGPRFPACPPGETPSSGQSTGSAVRSDTATDEISENLREWSFDRGRPPPPRCRFPGGSTCGPSSVRGSVAIQFGWLLTGLAESSLAFQPPSLSACSDANPCQTRAGEACRSLPGPSGRWPAGKPPWKRSVSPETAAVLEERIKIPRRVIIRHIR